MKTWRQRLDAYARADRFTVPPRERSDTLSRQQLARTRRATFQRSRMVRQPAVNRSFEGSIPSAGASLRSRRRRPGLLDRAHREHPALAARLAEHPPRKREDPVRFRTRAPSPPVGPYPRRPVCGRRRARDARRSRSRLPVVRISAFQAGGIGSIPIGSTTLETSIESL